MTQIPMLDTQPARGPLPTIAASAAPVALTPLAAVAVVCPGAGVAARAALAVVAEPGSQPPP